MSAPDTDGGGPRARSVDPARPAAGARERPRRRGLWRRRRNQRTTIARPPLATRVRAAARTLAHRLELAGKVLAVAAFLAGVALGSRAVMKHVIASPRFAVRAIAVAATAHVSADELRALTGVRIGDRLLAVDPDEVAARLAAHPWVASARVRRQLPSVLAIDVSERRARATALLGALYLVDERGRPFKRATPDEADGLPVITGVSREQYAALRDASEAVFREGLALADAYGARRGDAPARPPLSEIHVDPRSGFSLVLLDGGGEIRLGRAPWDGKLERLDRILGALAWTEPGAAERSPARGEAGTLPGSPRVDAARGPAALATVLLDGPISDRVTIRLRPPPDATADAAAIGGAAAGKKFRPPHKRGED